MEDMSEESLPKEGLESKVATLQQIKTNSEEADKAVYTSFSECELLTFRLSLVQKIQVVCDFNSYKLLVQKLQNCFLLFLNNFSLCVYA